MKRKIRNFEDYTFDTDTFEVVSFDGPVKLEYTGNYGPYYKIYDDSYNSKKVYLSKLILGIEGDPQVNPEFIDGNVNNCTKENLRIAYTEDTKHIFYKRVVKPTRSKHCNYQRLVLNKHKISLLEDVFIENTVDRGGIPRSFLEHEHITNKVAEDAGFKRYTPDEEEYEFYMANEKNLGIIEK